MKIVDAIRGNSKSAVWIIVQCWLYASSTEQVQASAASAAGTVAAITAAAAATIPRSGGVPPPFFWLPVLPARGVDSEAFATGGHAGIAAMGTGETAAAMTARLPALPSRASPSLPLSAGVIEGDGARAAAGAV